MIGYPENPPWVGSALRRLTKGEVLEGRGNEVGEAKRGVGAPLG
jgi:hypothetical protein